MQLEKQMAVEGAELMSKALKLADVAREAISKIPKLLIFRINCKIGVLNI